MSCVEALRLGPSLPAANQHSLAEKGKVAEVNSSDLRHIVVAHTGHSSQLFPIATGRNTQFTSQKMAMKAQLSCARPFYSPRSLKSRVP